MAAPVAASVPVAVAVRDPLPIWLSAIELPYHVLLLIFAGRGGRFPRNQDERHSRSGTVE